MTSNPQTSPGGNRDLAAGEQEKQVPHSLTAEMSVLGAMLLSKEATGQVIPIINEDCFFRPEHRIVFRALVSLYQQGQPPDPVILRRELKRMTVLDQVGGPQFIAQLMSAVPSTANVEYYARLVRDTHMLRRLILACNDTLQEAFTDAHPTNELLDRAEQRVFEITQDRIGAGPEPLGEFLDEAMRQLQESDGHLLTGVPTGLTEIDDLTSGLQRGELIIIAGRPSMGKTALALNIAEYMALRAKKRVAFFSLEMSKQQLVQRMLCTHAEVDSHKFRRNMLAAEDKAKLHLSCDTLGDSAFFIDDTPGMSILELRAKSRLLAVREHVEAVFVDYLQLMSSPGAESRQQEISMISRGLKVLARELNVPVIALSQLNRGVEGRESHRPRMSDLRESGSIEQEADLILLLHREDYYRDTGTETAEDTIGIAEAIIAKQRNGPVGTVQLQFNKKFTKFNNLAHVSVAEAESYVPPSSDNVPF